MSELHQCLLRAILREQMGWTGPTAKLTIVGKSVPQPTPAETFQDAARSIDDFARRWCDGSATLSEIEEADILLLGMRRLLADKVQVMGAKS